MPMLSISRRIHIVRIFFLLLSTLLLSDNHVNNSNTLLVSAFILPIPINNSKNIPISNTNKHKQIVAISRIKSNLLAIHSISNDDIIQTTATTKSSPEGDFSFFDEATIYVRAGSGGQGASTYKIPKAKGQDNMRKKKGAFAQSKSTKKKADGTPDGGSGGKGGNIILIMDESLNTLAGLSPQTLRPNAFGGGGAAASSKRMDASKSSSGGAKILRYRAEDGYDGGRMYDNGRNGNDCEVRVPPGTVVSIEHSNSINDDDDGNNNEYQLEEIGSITTDNPTLIVAKGGMGGEGTSVLKHKKKGSARRSPQGGERFRLRLTLKIVADVALVGVPNAGKSTFLGSVTRAKPRIADYPFTTVIPNLGTWIPPINNNNNAEQVASVGSSGLVLCDVPGLIEGASKGIGLGHAFLRHIERCHVILHLIDATSSNPVQDYIMINDELKKYGNGSLSIKPQVVVVNKIDALDDGDSKKAKLEKELKDVMGHTRLLWISAKERQGVDDLMIRMASYLKKIKEE